MPRIKKPTTKQIGNNHIKCKSDMFSNNMRIINNENKKVAGIEGGKRIPPLRT
jgi:hypothetical protein